MPLRGYRVSYRNIKVLSYFAEAVAPMSINTATTSMKHVNVGKISYRE